MKPTESSTQDTTRMNQLENELDGQNRKMEKVSRELRDVKQELSQLQEENEELIDEYRTLKANYLAKSARENLSEVSYDQHTLFN